MGAYMYPINIMRDPQMKSYSKTLDLPDIWLDLDYLKSIVKEGESFFIDNDEHKIYIEGRRLETPKETAERVKKEEQYMINYNKFHNK